jgi:hypothetical protein
MFCVDLRTKRIFHCTENLTETERKSGGGGECSLMHLLHSSWERETEGQFLRRFLASPTRPSDMNIAK